jgi:CheY-like chemotaxis protein
MDGETVDIVIVEDDPSDAELITRVFRKHSMINNIVLLKDGVEALDFFLGSGANDHPKVVLLDLKLPKVNGIEVLQRLKSNERTKNVPVVVLTSSAEDRDIQDAYRLGVNSYVTKPIKFEEFAQVVSELRLYWLLLNKPCEGQGPVNATRRSE